MSTTQIECHLNRISKSLEAIAEVLCNQENKPNNEMDDYTKRLLLLAHNVLYTDQAAPPREDLPGQGTVRYWIVEWVMNKRKMMPDNLISS